MPRKEGQFLVEDFYVNNEGLNTADSPFIVSKNAAAGGHNFDYTRRGAFQKRAGHTTLNETADTEVRSLGLNIWNKPGASIKCIRAAGRKIQDFDLSAFTITNLTEDTTAASSDILGVGATQPVVSAMFNNSNAGVLWMAGGGLAVPYGAYSATKVTKNGVTPPLASSFTAVAVGSGGTLQAGVYKYTLVYRKLSTQATSNASTATEASVTTTSSDSVTLAWTLTNNDTTKYDKILVYRSALNGSAGFTAGALVTTLASSATGYTDTGTSESSSESVPRAGSAALDNSELPSGTYNSITLWKRRLVAATGSTIYIGDTNKSESFPTANIITVPSGGDITSLSVISLTTATSSEIDELLVIHKQSEVWVITGSSIDDFALKFIANCGAPNQSVVVPTDGYLVWINHRGFYAWNGAGKPKRISAMINDQFERTGEIDKTKLNIAWGVLAEDRHEAQWYLSGKTLGEQQYGLKLDLNSVTGAEGGVFTPDLLSRAHYAGVCFLASATASDQLILLGDGQGLIYRGFSGVADGTSTIPMSYITPFLNFGTPTLHKRVHKVVAYVLDNGAFTLTCELWSRFRFGEDTSASRSLQPSTAVEETAVFDTAIFDTDVFDSATFKVKQLVYNMPPTANNLEGDSFRVEFSESSNTYQPIVYGFSIYYTELAARN